MHLLTAAAIVRLAACTLAPIREHRPVAIVPVEHSFLLTAEEADSLLKDNHAGTKRGVRYLAERSSVEKASLRPGKHAEDSSKNNTSIEEIIIPMGELYHNHFVGEVSIGTPPQKFEMVFDTGSTNVEVVGDSCMVPSCTKINRFHPSKSSTFSYTADPPIGVDITFGTGRIHSRLAVDTVAIGPYVVDQQAIAVIDRESSGPSGVNIFDKIEFQGMVGFGFPAMSSAGRTPFFDNLMHQPHSVTKFAIYMGPTNRGLKAKQGSVSAFLLNGYDDRFYSGDISFVPVAHEHYWQVELEALYVGDVKFCCQEGSNNYVIIDSGTTYNTLPYREIDLFHKLIPTKPCDWDNPDFLRQFPVIKYVLKGGVEVVFEPEQYLAEVWDEDSRSSTSCRPAYMQIDVSAKHGHSYILGSLVYMRNYFTVFQRGVHGEKSFLGIAKAAHSPTITSFIQSLKQK